MQTVHNHETHAERPSLSKSLSGLTREIDRALDVANGFSALRSEGTIFERFWAPNRVYALAAKSSASQEHARFLERQRARDELLKRRHAEALSTAQALDAQSYDQVYASLEDRAAETTRDLATPGEQPVPRDAPSRCPTGGSRLIEHENEVQRASRRLFQPNCDPRYRRVMVEMTPGIGKTCIYVGVIADFLGKRCKENGKYFDVIVLGDPDIFKSFRDGLRSCPAMASLYEYVGGEQDSGTPKKIQLLRHGTADTSQAMPIDRNGLVMLRDVNPGTDGACAVATRISSPGGSLAATPDEIFEEEKDERRCGSNRLVWQGSRVVFMPYALAARWVVFSGGGVPAADAAQHFDFASEGDRRAFMEDAGALTWSTLHQKYPQQVQAPQLKMAETSANSKYKKAGIALGAPNTVVIVDECQNLATPSRWKHPKAATQKQSAFLSEALWRQSADPSSSPYLFAGTGTPNVGTGVASSVCLMQIINGRGKATSFLPFHINAQGHRVPVETLAEFRALLARDPEAKLQWRKPQERHARYLIVNPRTFLDEDSGYVRDMTDSSDPFPLYLPTFADSSSTIVTGWREDTSKLTYQAATIEVRKCLPFATDAGAETADPQASVKAKGKAKAKAKGKAKAALGFQNEVAYKSFICAAKESDIAAQAARIYKPVYSTLNRRFIQDVALDRVFIVNSYYDAHYYPTAVPTASTPPLTQIVVPSATLLCWPRLADGAPAVSSVDRSTPPRLRAEADFPSATIRTPSGTATQYPWALPEDAARVYVRELQRATSPSLGALAWSERSFWASPDRGHGSDPIDLRSLSKLLVEGYWKDASVTDPRLESYLRDAVAYNSPKLVAAADDMYASRKGVSYSSPDVPVYGKSFFFLNVMNRRDDSFSGLDDNHFLILTTFYVRLRARPYVQWLFPEQPHAQHRIAWLDALKFRPARGTLQGLDLREVGSASGDHWAAWLRQHREASPLPSLYALADEKMLTEEPGQRSESPDSPYSGAVHARFLAYLSGKVDAVKFDDVLQLMGLKTLRDAMKDAINGDRCESRVLQHDRLAPAGQSALVAADAAHKAVDLRCVGFNLSFGPMPRGKRIQEVGRNWRSCSFGELADKEKNWQVHIRQLFLGPPAGASAEEAALLGRDLLLDSFYEAQDEALQWLRMITVSAGIGCSLWWAYSQWARQFEVYHTRQRRETAWFFGQNALFSPCMDNQALARFGRDAQTTSEADFYRCSKTARGSAPQAMGTVVPSLVGAFYANEVVGGAGRTGTAQGRCRAYTPEAPRPLSRRVLPRDVLQHHHPRAKETHTKTSSFFSRMQPKGAANGSRVTSNLARSPSFFSESRAKERQAPSSPLSGRT